MIGRYASSFYEKQNTTNGFWKVMSPTDCSSKYNRESSRKVIPEDQLSGEIVVDLSSPRNLQSTEQNEHQKPYNTQETFRDFFIWSVYAGNIEIAFVLLLHLKSRIGAALVATSIAQRLSRRAHQLHIRHTYKEHQKAYTEYAEACINACYTHDPRYACELLFREIPLLGNITCMQVGSLYQFNTSNELIFANR